MTKREAQKAWNAELRRLGRVKTGIIRHTEGSWGVQTDGDGVHSPFGNPKTYWDAERLRKAAEEEQQA